MQKLIVVLGPTASGKTALAAHLAGVFDGELINADSRQVYEGMDIGTAKAVPKLKSTYEHGECAAEAGYAKVKMWLTDIVRPNVLFTVADYKIRAIKNVSNIAARGKLPIMVGGTGLYIRAVVDNLMIPAIPVEPELRSALETKTAEELFEELKQRDPETALAIDRHNKRRLARALEVVIASGSSFAAQQKKGKALFDVLQIGINVPQKILFKRIENRVKAMIQAGLQNEVYELVRRYGWNAILSTTIGYKEWQPFFDKNTTIESVAIDIIKNTNQYVKKQTTWFRKDKKILWVRGKKGAMQYMQKFLR